MHSTIFYESGGASAVFPNRAIREGSIIFHSAVSASGKVRLGNVCSSYIEFDYYLSSGITLNIGERLHYLQDFDFGDADFNDVPGISFLHEVGFFYVTELKNTGKMCHVTAFDSVAKLNVDFSAHLKSIESSFPMTIQDLIDEVSSVTGLTIDVSNVMIPSSATPPLDFFDGVVNYFYANEISCRDVIKAIAEMCCGFVITGGLSKIVFRDGFETAGISYSSPDWHQSTAYIICPDDGTYTTPGGDTATNVWYRENGLVMSEPISPYDSINVYDVSGTLVGSYSTTTDTPYNFYLSNNILAQAGITWSGSYNLVDYLLIAVRNINADWFNGDIVFYSGTVQLFPFRNPFTVGQYVRIVDVNGNYYYLPVMSMDMSRNGVFIEAYSDKTVGAEAQNGVGSGGEDRSLALDVRVTALESQRIDGYTLVNFASASAGTISTYGSRSFSDYIWLVAEWVVNSSIRATMMFRRADFENAPYVSLFYVDSSNTQRWCELSYVDDTTLKLTASSNASGNIALFGLALASD